MFVEQCCWSLLKNPVTRFVLEEASAKDQHTNVVNKEIPQQVQCAWICPDTAIMVRVVTLQKQDMIKKIIETLKKENTMRPQSFGCIAERRIEREMLDIAVPLSLSTKQNCASLWVYLCCPLNKTKHLMLYLSKNGLPCQ